MSVSLSLLRSSLHLSPQWSPRLNLRPLSRLPSPSLSNLRRLPRWPKASPCLLPNRLLPRSPSLLRHHNPSLPSPIRNWRWIWSVPQELFEQALESETREDLAPVLPPLFGEKPEVQSPFQISGRLISNERVDDYWDSIEGAEVQFEFKQ
ncbi:hypothetical protein OMD46_15880 [Pseudomonas sp. MDMC_285]|nr:hypothetical protein [Pseudomonas sp. MDMC_285]